MVVVVDVGAVVEARVVAVVLLRAQVVLEALAQAMELRVRKPRQADLVEVHQEVVHRVVDAPAEAVVVVADALRWSRIAPERHAMRRSTQ